MGEIADDLIDSAMDDFYGYSDDSYSGYISRRRRSRNFQADTGDYMWKTFDGTITPMNEMSDTHLVNAIKTYETRGNSAKQIQLQEILDKRLKTNNSDGYLEFLKRVGDI